MIKALLITSALLGGVSTPILQTDITYDYPPFNESPFTYNLSRYFELDTNSFVVENGFIYFDLVHDTDTNDTWYSDMANDLSYASHFYITFPNQLLRFNYFSNYKPTIEPNFYGSEYDFVSSSPLIPNALLLNSHDIFRFNDFYWTLKFPTLLSNNLSSSSITLINEFFNSNEFKIFNTAGYLNSQNADNQYQNGYNTGYNVGYNTGFNDALGNNVNESLNFNWFKALFLGMGDLLSIRLFGDITIGSVALIMLSLTLLPFIIGLAKGKD